MDILSAQGGAAPTPRTQRQSQPEPLTYTIDQLRPVANIGRTRAYELIASGHIRAMKAGSRTLICAASLRAYLDSLPTIGPKGAA
ncbi:MAG: helix-turn-helix domain-containing protein [Paracraurococcus sp.]